MPIVLYTKVKEKRYCDVQCFRGKVEIIKGILTNEYFVTYQFANRLERNVLFSYLYT